jgi:hypothetical protein
MCRMAVAGVTGLEPAASGVTGRRSNRLSYTPLRAATSSQRRSSLHVRVRIPQVKPGSYRCAALFAGGLKQTLDACRGAPR